MRLRDVLAHLPVVRRLVHASELDYTEPRHRKTLQKADRVIEEYRKLDAALVLHARRK